MFRIWRLAALLVLLAGVLVISGCATAGRDSLIGKWEIVSGNSRAEWEFKQDGGFVMDVDGGIIETTFQFVDDDTILLLAPQDFGGEDATLDFRIEGDQLTLISADNSITFTRVK